MLTQFIVYKYNKLTSCYSMHPSPYQASFLLTQSIMRSLGGTGWVSPVSSSIAGHQVEMPGRRWSLHRKLMWLASLWGLCRSQERLRLCQHWRPKGEDLRSLTPRTQIEGHACSLGVEAEAEERCIFCISFTHTHAHITHTHRTRC